MATRNTGNKEAAKERRTQRARATGATGNKKQRAGTGAGAKSSKANNVCGTKDEKGEVTAEIPDATYVSPVAGETNKAYANLGNAGVVMSERFLPADVKVEDYVHQFTEEELGKGEFVSDQDAAVLITQHKGRENAGKVKQAAIKANIAHIDADTMGQKQTGAILDNAKQRVKNVRKRNELVYQVGKTVLKGQKRVAQLSNLSQEVQQHRNRIKIDQQTLMLQGSTAPQVDLSDLDDLTSEFSRAKETVKA